MIEIREFKDGRNGGKVIRYGGSVNGIRIPFDYKTASEVARIIARLS